MTNIHILITGIGGGGVGEQVLKAIKLSKKQYTVIGTDTTDLCKNKYEVDFFCVIPRADDPMYMNVLTDLATKYNVKALIPGSEPELKIISKNRSVLITRNVIPFINPESVIDICLDKFKTNSFLEENGFLFPRTVLIKDKGDLNTIDFFPAVIKPSVGGGGSANTMIAQNSQELELFGQYMLNLYNQFIIQEYVGTPEQEYTVSVLSGINGEFINSIVIKRDILTGLGSRTKIKNNTDKKSLGPVLAISSGISQGEVVINKTVSDYCEKLALILGAASAINIQCRLYNNQVYVFEINPRFSGTTSMRALVGYNEPDVLIRKEILKEEISPRFSYKLGYVLRGLVETYMEDNK